MKDVLGSVAVELNGTFGLEVQAHVASDGAVDSFLRITGIPRNFRLRNLMLDLEPIFVSHMESEYMILPRRRTWFYLAFTYTTPEGVKSADFRYRGMSVALTNASRCQYLKYPIPFQGARRIINNLERKKRLKPVNVALWLFWSSVGARPNKKPPEKKK